MTTVTLLTLILSSSYVDDLTVLELVMMGGLLSEYNFKQNVASDIGIDEQYMSAETWPHRTTLTTLPSGTQTIR